jgi:cytochrome c1
MKPPALSWTFGGVFGKFDTAQLQRGFQVYKEVCSACHSLHRVAIRTIADKEGPYFSPEQAASLAATFKVQDGPDDKGEMFERPGRPSDYFPSPFPNVEAAKAANNGAAPPDLSLIAKARGVGNGFPYFILDAITQKTEQAGPNYIHALLTGYRDAPAGVEIPPNTYYNPYFAGAASLSMPPPLQDGQVAYSDGSPQTVDQYATDVAAFLMWTAEPHLTDRKRIGVQVLVFLAVFAGLMYLTKRRVWAKVKGH